MTDSYIDVTLYPFTTMTWNPIGTPELDLATSDERIKDFNYYTSQTISGYVTIGRTTPTSKRVRLHSEQTGELLNEAMSDPTTGYYEFTVPSGTLTYVVVSDETGTFGDIVHQTSEQTNIVLTAQSAFDPDNYDGAGKIWGTIKDSDGIGLEREIVLFDAENYILLEQVTSDSGSDGYYEFTGLDITKEFVVIGEGNATTNHVIRAKAMAQ
jgi:hypothetical protein